jgi:DNA primase
VSTPLFWEEIESGQDVHGEHFNVRNVPERLESLDADPWEEFSKVRQSITAAVQRAVGMKS